MYKINEILTPIKFVLIMLQLILTITIMYTKQDNVLASISSTSAIGSTEYNSMNSM